MEGTWKKRFTLCVKLISCHAGLRSGSDLPSSYKHEIMRL
jgi:hypothetical protein